MGGPNLEVFKFGMYIMFPIGWMYYFGTNLDERFSVPYFWPKPEETHQIPFEKDEIQSELTRLRARRLAARQYRLQLEGKDEPVEQQDIQAQPSPILQTLKNADAPSQQQQQKQPEPPQNNAQAKGWFSWLR